LPERSPEGDLFRDQLVGQGEVPAVPQRLVVAADQLLVLTRGHADRLLKRRPVTWNLLGQPASTPPRPSPSGTGGPHAPSPGEARRWSNRSGPDWSHLTAGT